MLQEWSCASDLLYLKPFSTKLSIGIEGQRRELLKSFVNTREMSLQVILHILQTKHIEMYLKIY